MRNIRAFLHHPWFDCVSHISFHLRFVPPRQAAGWEGERGQAEEALLPVPAGTRGPARRGGRDGREGPARPAGLEGAEGGAGLLRLPHAHGGRHPTRHRQVETNTGRHMQTVKILL